MKVGSRHLVSVVALVLLLSLTFIGGQLWGSAHAPAAALASTTPTDSTLSAASLSAQTSDWTTAIRDVALRARPAVVQITSQQTQVDMFNQPFTVPGGVGSGFIYDHQGHILTNNHVIDGADQLLVSLPDGRSFPGELVGQDPSTDLAVVRISGDDLPIAQLGDSRQLQVGDWVVAIGNALALQGGPTVTAGVVSSLGRTVQEPGGYFGARGPYLYDVIQTDAPINPGNSGGPLLNLAAQVVGINTLVAGQAESGVQAQGIGFAISIATAKPIADQLVATGHASHPYLGLNCTALTPALAARLGLQRTDGLIVRSVDRGSPAAAAGFRVRDIVTEIDGVALKGESALDQAINAHKVGDSITLTFLRGGQEMSVEVTLVETPF